MPRPEEKPPSKIVNKIAENKKINFLKENSIALILVIFLFVSEYFHLIFEGIPFNGTVDLSHAIFYLTFSFFGSGLFVSCILFFLIDKKKVSSKAILTGIIFWNLIEAFENYCYLAKINSNVLIINDGSIWQICTTLLIVLLAWFGFSKYKS